MGPEGALAFCQRTDVAGAGSTNAVGRFPLADGLLFAIAGGLGNLDAAREASTLALDVLGEAVGTPPETWSIVQCLRRAVQAANVALYQKRITVPELRDMRTTLTATTVANGALVSAHVGDCRLWLLRDGTLTQLTKDHTWDGGVSVAPSTQPVRPGRHYAMPRCLGQELIVSIDVLSMDLRPWDVLAHTTEGVHRTLDEAEIRELLGAHPPEGACRALVRRARERGSPEDASAQVAAVGDLPVPRRWWRGRR